MSDESPDAVVHQVVHQVSSSKSLHEGGYPTIDDAVAVDSSDEDATSVDEVESPQAISTSARFLDRAKRTASNKIFVEPEVAEEFRPQDRRLTFRYINNAQFYKNRIFNHHSHIAGVLKSIKKNSVDENGVIQTEKIASIFQDQESGMEMNPQVEKNVSKLAAKLKKAHGKELSMMQVVGYMQRIRKLCTDKVNKIKHRKYLTRQVFLGGSCNPTTWRQDMLMPLLETRKCTYFNPQVKDWTPSCVYEEAIAKNEAAILFFVIDNQTRALASMIEVVENICADRVFVLIVKDVILGSTITGKTVDEHEYRELNLARAYLANLASRHGLLVFTDIEFAAHYMCDIVIPRLQKQQHKPASKIKHRHSTAYSTRAAYSNLGHLLIQQEEGNFNEAVFYTNRLVSCSCPFTVHDALEEALEESKDDDITPQVVYDCLKKHGVSITSELGESVEKQLNQTADHHQIVLFIEEIVRDHLRQAREEQSNTPYDVYLGGACNEYSSWRADIAIPIFDKLGVRYFDPQRIHWEPNHAFDELRAKFSSLVVMFVVDSKSRGLATMIDAVEMIVAKEQRIVLVVNDVDPALNPTIDPKECKDLNRARAYIADVATRHGLLVYSSVKHAVEYAAEKILLLNKFSGENERWNNISTAEQEPTIELRESDVLGSAASATELELPTTSQNSKPVEGPAATAAASAGTKGTKDTSSKPQSNVCAIL